jgi:hypothetical protein
LPPIRVGLVGLVHIVFIALARSSRLFGRFRLSGLFRL